MRKGSTSLGSLGVISSGIAVLILPLFAGAAKVLLTARPALAAQEPSAADDAKTREALQRRAKWLVSLGWMERQQKQASAVKPVKVIQTRATWYGPGFHGRRTASGERFNQHALTLASRHLPFGTRVRVVNPRTGRSAVARVNDRGPFGHAGYTADLSHALARRIGLLGSGPVRLEILPKGGG